MAEGVVFNVAAGIIGRLGSLAFQEIGLLLGVNGELEKLKETVDRLQAVLLDADQKQANNTEVKVWLRSAEDAVYEADDVLDECYTEARWRQMVPGNNEVSKQVRIFLSSSNQLAFGLKMGHKIKNINKKLHVIESRKPSHLEVIQEDTRFIARERVTHSFVPNEEIVGRDEDKRAIVQLLLDPISTENVSTISIVGFGGLGKTALTQLIFNDEVVDNHFELKIWVCASNSFQLDILVKKILQAATNEIEELQKELRKKVDGRKYLLVLDDVWNENRENWLRLKYLLMGGAKGSRILITTRSEIVATKSDTTKTYTLRGLDEDQSWSLFKKMAFEDGKEPENSTIKATGKEIARKCRGVPLAIRTICGMLRTKDQETEWLTFEKKKLSKLNQEENDILPTLKLSYDSLPSHLKHCFAYCSLFPPDYVIPVDRLVLLWMAQGFIKSSDENECLEDVGYEYYKELLWRSFFQEEEKDKFGMIKSCKMHDLMNDLAVSLSGVESTIIDVDKINFDGKYRHISFNFKVDPSKWKMPTALLNGNTARTFLFLSQDWYCGEIISFNKSFCSTIASNFKSLRMLSLKNLGIKTLPKCLRKLKHLRYLDLSCNSKMKILPNWIVKLQSLETLDLTECYNLVELPKDIKRMTNLRHLNLEGCASLARISRGLGELTNLRTLSRFVLSENNSLLRYGASVGELGRLKELRGRLEIENLRDEKYVVSDSESNVAILKDKQHLWSLSLRWKADNVVDLDQDEENDVIMSMEALQPHSNLKDLSVMRYKGLRLASWISSLTNIVNLSLYDCTRCQNLPPLDRFPFLERLYLSGFDSLECIADKEGSSSEMIPYSFTPTLPTTFFPSLKQLSLLNCPNLKGWWRVQNCSTASSSFPCLSELTIRSCGNLTSMPLYPNLDRLELSGTNWKVIPSSFSCPLHKLKSLQIEHAECVPEEIAKLISLQNVLINNCPNLTSLPQGIGNLTSLQELSIYDCSNLTSLPEEIGNLTSLQGLSIYRCSNLTSLPEEIGNITSLRGLSIDNCSNLTSLPEEIGNLTSLRGLSIYGCSNLTSLPEEIGNLTSLQSLSIDGCSNLTSLPEEIGNLTSLQRLSIYRCSNLTSLPQGIGNLTSLQRMKLTTDLI